MAGKILVRNITDSALRAILPPPGPGLAGFDRTVEPGEVAEITEALADAYTWSEGVWEIERPVTPLSASRAAGKKDGAE